MGRLYRPHIPLAVRVKVAGRDCYRAGINPPAREAREPLGNFLKRLLVALSAAIGCEVSELRLDHDPALGARAQVPDKSPRKDAGWSNSFGVPMRYEPPANDPDHLFYRPHGVQFSGSHDVKTRIRGDHGQHSDIALIKKMRRIEKGPKPKRGPPMKSGGFRTTKMKPKWPKRPFNRSKP
jgi:hypothetical protein